LIAGRGFPVLGEVIALAMGTGQSVKGHEPHYTTDTAKRPLPG
jgi:hypothetical protein